MCQNGIQPSPRIGEAAMFSAARLVRGVGQAALAVVAAVAVCAISALALLVTLVCAAPFKRLQAP